MLIARILPAVCLSAVVATSVMAQDASPQVQPVLLQMIRDDSVHEELRLTDSQRQGVLKALEKVDGRWFRSRHFPLDKQQAAIKLLTTELKVELVKILKNEQVSRLRQLERQALGTRMMARDDVAEALQLTAAQRASLAEAFVETDGKASTIQQSVQKGEKDASEGNREISRLQASERQQLVKTLTATQKTKLGSLTGNPFDFAQVRRMYPMAPELVPDGVTWLQGGPLKLKELRGKVVVVHFYAFQCINCQRNFPHYQAWDDDFDDEEVVIIGIQTPETSAERNVDRVSAAVKKDGMTYPILFDETSSNWKSWSNNVWPCTYLIDKEGFIRRWWRGEMNWKGTPGEQQMRGTIEQLIAEEA